MTIGLLGAEGRMGAAIQAIHEMISLESIKDAPGDLSAVIDFSSPEGTKEAAIWCSNNGVPLVTGTTGLEASEQSAVREA